jgi:hypothetical protein
MLINVKKSMYKVNKKLKKENTPQAGSFIIFNSLCNINWKSICRTSGLENREYGRRDPLRWPRGTLCRQKLARTSPTSCGRSVGIVRLRTQATKFTSYVEHSSVSSRMSDQSPKPFPNHHDCRLSNINVTRPKWKLTLHLSTTSCELTGFEGESQYILNLGSRLRCVYSLTQPPCDLGSSSSLETKLSSSNGRDASNGDEKVLPLPKNRDLSTRKLGETRLQVGQSENRGSISVRAWSFCIYSRVQTGIQPTQLPMKCLYWEPCLGLRRSKHEVNHLPRSIADF